MHTGVPHNQRLAGVWSLHQSDSVAEVTTETSRINLSLDMPGVVGHSSRTPWSAIETSRGVYDFSIWEACLALTNAKKKLLAVRPMAGFRCPEYLYDTDSCRYFSGGNSTIVQDGSGGNNSIASLTQIGDLSGGIDSAVTSMTVVELSGKKVPEVPFAVMIGTEAIQVGARALVSGTTYTYSSLTRGYDGPAGATNPGSTVAAAHSDLDNVGIRGRIPDPVTTGGATNTAYMDRWESLVDACATWCRANKVPFLHLMWPGLIWSEIYNEVPLRVADGRAGYSTVGDASPDTAQELIDAHKNHITRALAYTGTDLAVEFSNSGHGASGNLLTSIQSQITTSFGNNSGQCYIQANNVDVEPFSTGTPANISKGLQLNSSDNGFTQAQWEDIFQTLGNGFGANTYFEYLEVYTGGAANGDFDDANAKYLMWQATNWFFRTHKSIPQYFRMF